MLKILLCFNMVISMLNTRTISKVNNIGYTAKDYKNNILNLNIDIAINRRDIITLDIYFYKDKVKQDKYYTSSLTLEESSETTAKIPIEISEKMEMNVTVTSNNLGKEIANVFLPLYPYEEEICILKKDSVCSSKYPSEVSYKNNKINEEYETVSLVNNNLSFYSFNNLLPLDKISLVTNSNFNYEGYGLMNIENYNIPIRVSGKNIKKLELENKYYLDIKTGMTYDNYVSNTIYDNKIVFPYINKEYRINIELYDSFIVFNKVSFCFIVITDNSFIGDCSGSVYCFRRVYL